MTSESGNDNGMLYPYIPQDLMYEIFQILNVRIGGIPDHGYHFHLVKNLRAAFEEAGRSRGLLERVKNIDIRGADYLRALIDDIVLLDDFVNPKKN